MNRLKRWLLNLATLAGLGLALAAWIMLPWAGVLVVLGMKEPHHLDANADPRSGRAGTPVHAAITELPDGPDA